MQIQDVPVEEMDGEILCVDRVAENWVYLLMSTESNDDLVTIRIKQDLLLSSLNVQLQELTMAFPCYVSLKKKGSEAVELNVLDWQ